MTGKTFLCLAYAVILFAGAGPGYAYSSDKPGPQAVSLLGKALYAATPSAQALAAFEKAKEDYETDPGDPEKLIWYGRRMAYLGRYQKAIDIFSEGVEKHPNDVRMLRHRGHRYISTRQLDKAIQDLSKAAQLMVGQEDQVEPDGMPNAMNIPLTTTQGNIRYHLGLAYYLKQEWEAARRIFAEDLRATDNDDGIVASTHWLYMILRRLGRDQEAEVLLKGINADMNIIENFAYHRACLFYKGEIPIESVLPEDGSGSANAGLVYGVANWHLYNGRPEAAADMMRSLLDGPQWAAFGYIAAEADLASGQF
jgi:tetratricopeptide (TPR) repeat protein